MRFSVAISRSKRGEYKIGSIICSMIPSLMYTCFNTEILFIAGVESVDNFLPILSEKQDPVI